MLRITESSSPDAAKRYYTKALSTGEYPAPPEVP